MCQLNILDINISSDGLDYIVLKGGSHELKFKNIDEYCSILSKICYYYEIVGKFFDIWCNIYSWYNGLHQKFVSKREIFKQR